MELHDLSSLGTVASKFENVSLHIPHRQKISRVVVAKKNGSGDTGYASLCQHRPRHDLIRKTFVFLPTWAGSTRFTNERYVLRCFEYRTGSAPEPKRVFSVVLTQQLEFFAFGLNVLVSATGVADKCEDSHRNLFRRIFKYK